MTPVPRTPGRSTGKRNKYSRETGEYTLIEPVIRPRSIRRRLEFLQMPKRSSFRQSEGFTSGRLIRTSGGYKKPRISKLFRSNIEPYTLALGWKQTLGSGAINRNCKYMITEFNPGVGGLLPCAYNSNVPDFGNVLTTSVAPNPGLMTITQVDNNRSYRYNPVIESYPMHVFDLNAVPYATSAGRTFGDSIHAYDVEFSTMNTDLNSRGWVFCKLNTSKDTSGQFNDPKAENYTSVKYGFAPIRSLYGGNATATGGDVYIDEPRYEHVQRDIRHPGSTSINASGSRLNPLSRTNKLYKKGVFIDFNGYSCVKQPVDWDIRVIRCLDKRYCPDYKDVLQDDERKQVERAWMNLVYPYMSNPMLTKEDNPTRVKKWFKTVCKATLSLPEQTGDADVIPSQRARMYAKINEVLNFAWDQKGETVNYDLEGVPRNVTEDSSPNNKPWYTSRLYLVIRASSRMDTRWSAAGSTQRPGDVNMDGSNILTGTWAWRRSEYNTLTLTDKYNPDPGGFIAPNYTPTYDLVVKCSYLCDKSGDLSSAA